MRWNTRYNTIAALVLLAFLIGGTLGLATADWRKLSPVRGPGNQVVATAVTPDGTRAATVTEEGHVSLWDLDNRKLIRSRHLPYGTPIHLAIRNQADAIAVAYEEADAVIWWCDGSDKLVLPDVDARLVAFAHQKRLLAVAERDGYGSTWDIDDGSLVNHTDVSGYIDGPFIAVLPNDQGAMIYNNGLLGANGFRLKKPITIGTGGTSVPSYASRPFVYDPPEVIGVFSHHNLGVTFYEWDVPDPQRTPITLPSNYVLPPVCGYVQKDQKTASGKMTTFRFGGGIAPARNYVAISGKSAQLTNVVTGNDAGDFIIYRRASMNDLVTHPVPWLVIPGCVVFAVVLLRRRWYRLENPLVIDPADATIPLPRVTRIAAWLVIGVGALAVLDMIYSLFTDGFSLRLDALGILAGYRIRQRRNGWRVFAVVLAWLSVFTSAMMLGTVAIGQTPLEYTLGSQTCYLPIGLGSLIALGVLGIAVFILAALTHPLAVRVCKAAGLPDVSRRELRVRELTQCATCGYNTARTVMDGLYDCPECGNHLRYNQAEQAWVREQEEAAP